MSQERHCRVCGCTDDRACRPHGCYWVEADLCSACRPPKLRKPREVISDRLRESILNDWAVGAAVAQLAASTGRPTGTILTVIQKARREGDPRAAYRRMPRQPATAAQGMPGHV